MQSEYEEAGRINVHLGKMLKQELITRFPGYGTVSNIIRGLVQQFLAVEGEFLMISKQVHTLMDEERYDEMTQLLTQELIAMRERRVNAGTAASATRSARKASNSLAKHGIETPEQTALKQASQDALEHIRNLQGGNKDATTN